MIEVILFVEDQGHRHVIGGLLERVAKELGISINPRFRNAAGGLGRTLASLREYVGQISKRGASGVDLVVVAIDANCRGAAAKRREIEEAARPLTERGVPIVCAIPDPHVERWLLLDSAAFRQVFGKGCHAPDQKCEKSRYKSLLLRAIREAGDEPLLGGVEFAADLIEAMDLASVASREPSVRQFLDDLRRALRDHDRTGGASNRAL
ncbi:MAG TPA: DUF4276 family protein [Myxococcota bacterium]|nr:DUF4276 family protein [Myxococcota bacterium]